MEVLGGLMGSGGHHGDLYGGPGGLMGVLRVLGLSWMFWGVLGNIMGVWGGVLVHCRRLGGGGVIDLGGAGGERWGPESVWGHFWSPGGNCVSHGVLGGL